MNENEVRSLFRLFVEKDKKYLDIQDFLVMIRGPISTFRRQLIERAFTSVNSSGDGILDCEELIEKYDPSQHPDVRNQVKKSQEVFREFLRTFEVRLSLYLLFPFIFILFFRLVEKLKIRLQEMNSSIIITICLLPSMMICILKMS